MTFFSSSLRLLCTLFLLAPLAAAGNSAPAPASNTSAQIDSVARFLAGVMPTLPEHQSLAASADWREHQAAVQAGWVRVKKARAASVAQWRDGAIPDGCPAGGTLLYPFSGPDFANAYMLFAGCKRFVLWGLEHPGEVPPIADMDAQAVKRLLAGVRVAVGDLVERNYFITSKMAKQLRTAELRGVVPVIIASMSLAGLEVRSIEPLELKSDVAAAPREDEAPVAGRKPIRRLKGVSIVFQRPGAREPQTLTYFSLDATDRGLAYYPEFLDYVRNLKPATMLLKSASYLLHGREFSALREALLDTAEFLVQDDTGMPYDVLRSNGWQVRLYGNYARPIDPFKGAYQPTLARAYQTASPGSLPFAFGYHWKDGQSNAMVAHKTAVGPVTLRLDLTLGR